MIGGLARRLLREPLLHFLLMGIALFVVYERVAGPSRAGTRIVVSEAMVLQMAREHEARWSRKPSEQELEGLIDTYVRDEILYREGLALGLERDDPLIKRRVRQKFEVVMEEEGSRAAPSDAELTAYVAANAGRFRQPATVTFEQVFLGDDPKKLGQASHLPGRMENSALDLVARDFGAGFARQVETAPLGQWSGPIASGFGVHRVRVSARTPSALPELDAIRRAAAREWEDERRAASRSDNFQRLRGRYTVVIEAKKPVSLAAQR